MKNHSMLFTAGRFAELHGINKRTLHYYDEIGLLSPEYKGENGYRYYTYIQSIQLEMILSLRKLNLSIEEIKNYLMDSGAGDFQKIARNKIEEIDREIAKLQQIKHILKEKSQMLDLCQDIKDGEIELTECEEESLFLTYGNLKDSDMEILVKHLQNTERELSYKKNCGTMIAVEKIKKGAFDKYDCFFTESDQKIENGRAHKKPGGMYIRAFLIGEWNRLPDLYRDILDFAKNNGLELFGYAYEKGLNEIAIRGMEEYITQVLIPCKKVQI